jgi:hypothetical protein
LASFQFVDSDGAAWMVLPGLPADHPEADAGPEENFPFAGLTFRAAATGELRVLTRSAFPRPASSDIEVPPRGASRVRPSFGTGWEALLRVSVPWPSP